jgi:hypothetical protein
LVPGYHAQHSLAAENTTHSNFQILKFSNSQILKFSNSQILKF